MVPKQFLDFPLHNFKDRVKQHLLSRAYYKVDDFLNDKVAWKQPASHPETQKMCLNIEVIMPIVENFMLVYPLRCGAILIFIWTLFRTMFCIVFITTTILEVLIGVKLPLDPWSWLAKRKPELSNIYLLYYTQVTLLLCEGVLLVFLIYLAVGVSRFRTMFCIVFITTTILEVLIGVKLPLDPWSWLAKRKPELSNIYLLYYTQVTLLLCEGVLLVFLIYLAVGVSRRKPRLLSHYLICRFLTWILEIACLLTLCFINDLFIGWYLGIMFFVVLEFYSFIVVYSYYVKLREDKKILKDSLATKA